MPSTTSRDPSSVHSSNGRGHRPRKQSATLIDVGPSPEDVAASLNPPMSPGSLRSDESSHSLAQLGAHPCEVERPSSRPYRDFPERVRPVSGSRRSDSSIVVIATDETAPLLAANGPDTGNWYRGPLFKAGVKLSILFALFSALVMGTFYFGLPKVEPDDRPALKIPRSFDELKALKWVSC